ncbi:LysR family substrate-binding domain-containing protein [Amycolatopsis rhabdoformis]|uniref:LysR family substrate-binding domain-containing protein n=1 Tax=Amycolatopsis rhabdoformis TaxID=1448059 RepID=A0ABZ1I4E6_9PSEU|nr:LysR family substrate-binding domain-containing protein [Amycolatopsis rhabdoformis]WSE28821.1 LysR family substrate-binding domain-containing protein [Amycolatopsis rhabdoformis]
MTGPDAPPSFTLGYVPGVTPGKWVRTWQERLPRVPLVLESLDPREAVAKIHAREVDAALLRLPIDRTGLHAIPLYTETTVVVVPKDHLVAAADEVTPEDLAEELVLHAHDDTLDWPGYRPDRPEPLGKRPDHRPDTTADAIELVAAGVGLLVVPQSLARLHHRRDLTYRPLADVPESRVALSWLEDETTDLVEQFIGIVRGRTVNSTRGNAPAPVKKTKPKPQPTTKKQPPKRGKPRRRS